VVDGGDRQAGRRADGFDGGVGGRRRFGVTPAERVEAVADGQRRRLAPGCAGGLHRDGPGATHRVQQVLAAVPAGQRHEGRSHGGVEAGAMATHEVAASVAASGGELTADPQALVHQLYPDHNGRRVEVHR
jgi:hypothetical protein